MTHTVAVGEFEGPLGLLLELVERNKLEVTEISVAKITSEYLLRIQQLNEQSPENISEFLQLGARLLYIKSLALLPLATPDEQVEELHQLNVELSEYRRYKAAATELEALVKNRTQHRSVAIRPDLSELPFPSVNLRQMADVFARAIKRAEPAAETRLVKRTVNMETMTRRLTSLLPSGFELGKLLDECANRMEIIVMFLALLELIRGGAAKVVQANQYAPILVEAASG